MNLAKASDHLDDIYDGVEDMQVKIKGFNRGYRHLNLPLIARERLQYASAKLSKALTHIREAELATEEAHRKESRNKPSIPVILKTNSNNEQRKPKRTSPAGGLKKIS